MRYFFLLLLICISNYCLSQQQFTVYFDSNKFELNSRENERLERWTDENNNNKVIAIHGFTDEVGTTGFNDTLAQKRVDHVFRKIKSRIKIRDDFKTVSYGESHEHSKIKAENRKVVIYFILEKDLSREDEILGIKKEPITDVPKREIVYPERFVFENPDGSRTEYRLDRAFMKKVGDSKPGEKLKIENLNFIVNTYAVVPESRGKLFELLLVLQKNPKLKIEIQGHLCCMPYDRTDLSTQRAKAVNNFLIAHDIHKDRISYRGFGSTQPIYPIPEKNEQERAANRRVEILIVDNE